jgi:hypothetical protein
VKLTEPPATPIRSAPENATAMPAHACRGSRSPRNPTASSAAITGDRFTMMLAAPAGTVSSPAFRSSW